LVPHFCDAALLTRRHLTRGFKGNWSAQRRTQRRTQAVNHAAAVFIENKRYREEHRSHADVVNPKLDLVYQTDAN